MSMPDTTATSHRGDSAAGSAEDALLRVTDLKKHYPVRRGLLHKVGGWVKAVDGVSLTVKPAETLGIVGESGCGKSTLGRTVLRLLDPNSGRIEFEGIDITNLSRRQLGPVRARMQMIFQDPMDSLDPNMTVGEIVGEGLRIHGIGDRKSRSEAVKRVLEQVGLRSGYVNHRPTEFSGGQRQRIGIARALALQPRLIIADEPVSALDVSIQAQVLNLMADLKERLKLTYVFIAHNLAVVGFISDRVAVMYLGRIVEIGRPADLYTRPLHPYTRVLVSSILPPHADYTGSRIVVTGDVPSPLDPPSGCRFRTRCPLARARGTIDGVCAEVEPPLIESRSGQWAACHFVE